jgi:hypothetical protein
MKIKLRWALEIIGVFGKANLKSKIKGYGKTPGF